MKIKINEQDYDNKVLFHLVRVDSYLNECPKCKGNVFKAKVEQGDLGVVFYKTVCVKCDYEQLDGSYVSTISKCKDGCVLK